MDDLLDTLKEDVDAAIIIYLKGDDVGLHSSSKEATGDLLDYAKMAHMRFGKGIGMMNVETNICRNKK